MSLGLVVLVVGQGFSSIGAVRAVEDVALGVIVVAALMGAVAFVAVRLADWREPESEAEFEELVRHSEELAREGLAVDPDENEFMELDPLNDEDFEELVRDALDDLPDLLRNALAHVAVVISDGGRRARRLRPLPGRPDPPRRHPRPDRDLPRHAAPRLRPRRRICCATRSRARCATSSPTTSASTSWASAASICRRSHRIRARCPRHQPRREPQMPEAVIVDAIRTPIGRAVKGSLKSVRADDLAAIPLKALIERNPQLDQSIDRRRDDGLRLRRGRGRLQHRAHRLAARGHRLPRAGLHRQPLLRLLAADDADGLPRDQGRRGRHLHRRRRRGRLARRAGQRRSSSIRSSTAPRARSTTSTSRWA